MIYAALIAYAAAMVSANLLVVVFGPAITPLNAFVLIGFDLAMRDWLHVRLRPWQMLALIAATGGITFALNPAAGMIAIASAVSFTAAALVDWGVFSSITGSWMKRSNLSNVAGAAVDSVVFPTLAFGMLIPHIIALQFIAKVAGGALWSWLLNNARK
jgi:uncharacterized PurR-regulated membrane protein YhhQ (DUF165 family)